MNTKKNNSRKRGVAIFFAKAFAIVFSLTVMTAMGLVAGVVWAVNDTAKKLPEYQEIRQIPSDTTIRYFSAEGKLIHSKGPEYGEWIEYEKIPENMKKAIIAVEDQRYREHYGVDPVAIGRAVKFAWDNRGTGRRMQGASTITQQITRLLFLDRRYDFKRKIDEMIIALALERKLSKGQILELYLNKAYFGGGSYGIDAAARTFFGHDATELTLEEAALLAGLVKAPSEYSPTADPEAAEGRMRTALRLIRETGEDPNANQSSDLPELRTKRNVSGQVSTRYFIDWIEPQIEQIAPGVEGRIDVYTTISSDLQEKAQESAEKNAPGSAETALVSMDTSGAIRSMVGGRDYVTSNYNRATEARRQPGSAFKLFVYLTAIESGFGPQSSVYDGPINIGGWSPTNSSGRYSGNIALKTAFSFSLNTVAARLGQRVGTERIAQMAQRLGVSTPINTDPSMVLGTMDVRLLDMTRAYATVANKGMVVVPYGIEKIEQNGKTVYEKKPAEQQIVISQSTAAIMTSLLRGVVEEGTARNAQIGRAAAGKTGTTSENKDGWFLGFSSGIVTGVWVGRDDARPIANLEGGRAPARIFSDYMRKAVEGKDPGFETIRPPAIKGINLLPEGGQRKPGNASPAVQENAGESGLSAVPVPIKQPPPSKEGKSRAIRPDQ